LSLSDGTQLKVQQGTNRLTNPIVIKLGGSTLGSRDTILEDVVALQRKGEPAVVVHGGGKKVSEWLDKLGIATSYVGGLRVTDEKAMEVIVAVLGGVVNKEIVAGVVARGGRAIGLSGLDGGMLLARVKDPALGLVGEVVRVDPAPLWKVLEDNYIPVVAPFAVEEGGRALNVNGDTAASAIAQALGARKLIFLTDVPGVLDSGGKTLRAVSRQEGKSLASSGTVNGGMLLKVEACFLSRCSCLIIDGREPHALLEALEGRAKGTSVEGGNELA
jgi:acetylglutamate kinase